MFAPTVLMLCVAFAGNSSGDSARTKEKAKPEKTAVRSPVERFALEIKKKREGLLRDINGVERKVKKAKLDAQTKRQILDAIDKDRMDFNANLGLPKCDELIAPTLKFLDEIQPVVEDIEKYREKQKDRANESLDPVTVRQLSDLDQQLNQLIPGRDQFENGSRWHGTRSTLRWSIPWEVEILAIAGNQFRGTLRQPYEHFEIQGQIKGMALSFHTTKILHGDKNYRGDRRITFLGFLFGDRIVGHVEEIDPQGMRQKNSPVSLELVNRN
ncbi:MAG: hypothetical protein U1D30_14825 [Planctomycetota bacterium]